MGFFTQAGFFGGAGFSAGVTIKHWGPSVFGRNNSDKYSLTWLDTMPTQLGKYRNSYIFVDDGAEKKLYFVDLNAQSEYVKLNNLEEFLDKLDVYKQSTNIPICTIDSQQIEDLITSNGGHKPSKPEVKSQNNNEALAVITTMCLIQTFGLTALGYLADTMLESTIQLAM